MRSIFLAVAVLAAWSPCQQSTAFMPNNGQWDPTVLAAANKGAVTLWLTQQGLTIRAVETDYIPSPEGNEGPGSSTSQRGLVVQVEFVSGQVATSIRTWIRTRSPSTAWRGTRYTSR